MHLDTVFTMLDRDKVTAYPRVVDQVRAISLRPGEQRAAVPRHRGGVVPRRGRRRHGRARSSRWSRPAATSTSRSASSGTTATTSSPSSPGVVVAYERNTYTIAKMREAGVEVDHDRGLRARQGPRWRALHDVPADARPGVREAAMTRRCRAGSWSSCCSSLGRRPARLGARHGAPPRRRRRCAARASAPSRGARRLRRVDVEPPPTPRRDRRSRRVRDRRACSTRVLPIVVLIALLALTIALFGIDATNGPLQVALLLSAAFASLIAFKNGYTVAGGRGRRGRRRHVRGGRDLHPARGRRADRHLEHGRHHPDHRRLSASGWSARPGSTSPPPWSAPWSAW